MVWTGAATSSTDVAPAVVERIRLHHGAVAAAIGVVVHLILLVGGIVPDLVGLDADEIALLGSAQNALIHHIAHRVRKQRHNVNSHRCASPRVE